MNKSFRHMLIGSAFAFSQPVYAQDQVVVSQTTVSATKTVKCEINPSAPTGETDPAKLFKTCKTTLIESTKSTPSASSTLQASAPTMPEISAPAQKQPENYFFKSPEACVSAGLPQKQCVDSQALAAAIKPPHYETLSDCQQKHGNNCVPKSDTTTTSHPIMIGEMTMIMPVSATTEWFEPKTIGWAASPKDLNEASPVFATRDPNMGTTKQGTLIRLER